jgi:hypothetical protein
VGSTRYGLERLIAPTSLDEFFEHFYETRTLHVRRKSPRFYAALFSLSEADNILWAHEARIPDFLDVTKRSKSLEPRDTDPTRLRDWAHAAFESGATLVYKRIHDLSVTVARLQRDLESAILGRVRVNGYLTPPRSRGLAAHFDSHDTLILQIHGKKRWRLFGEGQTRLPLESQRRPVLPSERRAKATEIELEAGDLLYVPRGHIHDAATDRDASLHLTAGLYPILWSDVLLHLVRQKSASDVALRRSLPPLPDGRLPRDVLTTAVASILRDCERGEAMAASAGMLRQGVVAALRPLPDLGFDGGDAVTELTLRGRVEKRPGMVCRVAPAGAGKTGISFPGLASAGDEFAAVIGPVSIAPALRFIAASQSSFPVSRLPGNLSGEAKLVLVHRLIREGLLRRQPRLHPPSSTRESARARARR